MGHLEYRRVLVAGATGFVGSCLRVALQSAGLPVRLCTRDVGLARRRDPTTDWVAFDADQPPVMEAALDGCDAAYFLVHRVGTAADYPRRERRTAQAFAGAAARVGVRRIIYLGGVSPRGIPSPHLRSRLETGRILRGSRVPTVELRAAMVIGYGSSSWHLVRDLVRSLPVMVLPRFIRYHSWPVAIDDVVYALVAALVRPSIAPGCYELSGPERISHREVLLRAAQVLGRPSPLVLGVPAVSPLFASYWTGRVTSVDATMARELARGLTSDLDPTEPLFWELAGDRRLVGLQEAMRLAVADEGSRRPPSHATRARLREIGRAFRG